MTQQGTAAHGFTPGKVGLIAILALLFVATMVYQFGSLGKAPAPLKKRSRVGDSNENSLAGNEAQAVGSRVVRDKWPEITVAEAAQFDPFAFPEVLSIKRLQSANAQTLLQPLNLKNGQSVAAESTESSAQKNPSSGEEHRGDGRPQELKRRLEEQRAVAAELQRRGVGVILRTSLGAVAQIGELEVRVGDVLNGLRVAEIGPDGIRLVADTEDEGRLDTKR